MTRSIAFQASHVEIIPETGFVGFADEVSKHYFWLKPIETPTSFSTVKDDIWLERDDQRYGGAGGDWSIDVGPSSFILAAPNAPWLGCNKIAITFNIEPAKYQALLNLLNIVMSGCHSDFKVVTNGLHT